MAGAFDTGIYPNYFELIGINKTEADRRVKEAFETMFFDPEDSIWHDTDPDSGCLVDTGNNDARTEGMSYGCACSWTDRSCLTGCCAFH